jgi:hypothetical protein
LKEKNRHFFAKKRKKNVSVHSIEPAPELLFGPQDSVGLAEAGLDGAVSGREVAVVRGLAGKELGPIS